MKIKKLTILKSIVFFGSVILVFTSLTGCQKNSKTEENNDNYELNQSSQMIDNEKNTVENNDTKVIKSENNTQKDNTLHNDDTTLNNQDNIKTNNQATELTESDKIVISTFDNIEKDVDRLTESNVNENTKNKLKGTFITVVDFIFYDGEIKGIKFNDLTEGAKQKVLESAKRIDDKIETKIPGYKENISNKTKNAYNKAGEIIKKGADNIKDFSKEKLGEENYNSIIDAKDELVYYTKNAFDIVGDITNGIWQKGKSKIKSWYENFRHKQ